MKKLLLLFIVVLMALPTLARDFTYTYNGKTLRYTVLDEVAKTCQTAAGYFYFDSNPAHSYYEAGNNVSGDLVIPSVANDGVREYIVTSIGEYAFYYCSYLTSVTIPNSVTSIGFRAFQGCNWLSRAEFASLEALCKISFGGSSANPLEEAHHLYINGEEITELVIPESITSIGEGAFEGCNYLTKAEFASIEALCKINFGGRYANPLEVTHHLYINGKKVYQVDIPDSITSIGNYAFSGCSDLNSVTIPNSVTTIGDYAFRDCVGLSCIKIPTSVNTIGKGAFYNCSLKEINFGSIETLCNMNFGDSYANPISNIHHLYIGGEEITELVIPESVTSIGDYVFADCWYLTSVTIPNSVTEIGSGTFYNCSGLTELTIGNSVSTIGGRAFSGCKVLPSVTIPNSVTEIGDYAFSDCSGLTELAIGNSVTTIGNYVFSNCSGLTELTIDNSVSTIGDYTFSKCSGLTSVTIGNSVTSIGEGAFYDCSGLTSVTIGNSVTEIGSRVFSGCRGLTSVTIPNSVTAIGGRAFSGCSGLPEITIGGSVTEIGNCAFDGCVSLKEVTIVDSEQPLYVGDGGWVDYYGETYAGGLFCQTPLERLYLGRNTYSKRDYNPFRGLPLKSLTIGSSVTEIDGSFSDCSSLTEMILQDVNKWSQMKFYYKSSNPIYYSKKFKVGDSDKTVRHLDLDLGDKSVSAYAFVNAQNLATVRVKGAAIEANAFASCSNIQKICLDVDALSENCFSDNLNLAEVYCPREVPPTAFDNSFGIYKGVKLYVPKGCADRYRDAENCWWNFSDVYESDFSELDTIFKADYGNDENGINEVVVDKEIKGIDYNAAYDVYNLSGVRVGDNINALAPGIYIVRQGAVAKKIAVK